MATTLPSPPGLPPLHTSEPPAESSPTVKGRLRAHLSYWEDVLKAPPKVLRTIREGYQIKFSSPPPQASFRNNRSALAHQEFVSTEIQGLLKRGCVRKLARPPFVTNPLTVSTNGTKLRLILDLRYVNDYIPKEYIKFDDWDVFQHFISEGCWMYKFDLSSGYHHIDIHPSSQGFLGFSWAGECGPEYFVFTVLPFGLSPAPRIFTRTLRPLSVFWHDLGIKIAVYIDDGGGAEDDLPTAVRSSGVVRDTLCRAGFLVNTEKSVWDPCQIMTWLGITADSIANVTRISDKRISKCVAHIDRMLSRPYTSARNLARFVGLIISTSRVIGAIVFFNTRYCNDLVVNRVSWDRSIKLFSCNDAIREIIFWKQNLVSLNSRPFVQESHYSDVIVHSDASAFAIGAVTNDDRACHRSLCAGERIMSSTYRELLAILYGLRVFNSHLTGKRVDWFVDNFAASVIVVRGSARLHLHKLASDIQAASAGINLTVSWVPRECNTTADILSKYVDADAWEVADAIFQHLQKVWGPVSLDVFANSANTKAKYFYSKFYEIGTLGVDAFSQPWSGHVCWIVPPISEIQRVLAKLRSEPVMGVLGVPYWPSAGFWPLLRANGNWASFVVDSRVFSDSHDQRVVLPGPCPVSAMGSDTFYTRMVFLRVAS